MTSSGWAKARDVLCVRLDSIGDVLMTTPAIRALAAAHPRRRITLLTSRASTELAPLVPEVHDTIAYDPPWMKHPGRSDRPEIDREMVETLRGRRFDAAAVFTVYSQSPLPAALLCFLAGIPLRLAHSRDKPYGLLTDWVPDPEPESGIRHEVERQLALVETVGAAPASREISLRPPAEAEGSTREALRQVGVDPDGPYVVVHPGASAPSRRWPAERYGVVAAELAARGLPVVVTGTRSERDLVDDVVRVPGPSPLRNGGGVVSLAGRLSLAQLASLLDRSRVVVTNNTGPAHIAAGVGTPVVVLYALTNPQHTPWMVPSRVLSQPVPCANCQASRCPEGHHACLLGVGPGRVVDAVLGHLTATPAQAPV